MVTDAARMSCNSGIKVVLPCSAKYTSTFTLLVGRGHACRVTRAYYQSYLEVTLDSGVVMASLGPCQTVSAELPSWL